MLAGCATTGCMFTCWPRCAGGGGGTCAQSTRLPALQQFHRYRIARSSPSIRQREPFTARASHTKTNRPPGSLSCASIVRIGSQPTISGDRWYAPVLGLPPAQGCLQLLLPALRTHCRPLHSAPSADSAHMEAAAQQRQQQGAAPPADADADASAAPAHAPQAAHHARAMHASHSPQSAPDAAPQPPPAAGGGRGRGRGGRGRGRGAAAAEPEPLVRLGEEVAKDSVRLRTGWHPVRLSCEDKAAELELDERQVAAGSTGGYKMVRPPWGGPAAGALPLLCLGSCRRQPAAPCHALHT